MNKIFKNKYDVTTGVTKAVARNWPKNNGHALNQNPNSHSLSPFNPTRTQTCDTQFYCSNGIHLLMQPMLVLIVVLFQQVIGENASCTDKHYSDKGKYNCHFIALNPANDLYESDFSVMGLKSVAIGNAAKARGSQAVTVGNGSAANSQSIAVGADVFAYGKSSVAIGNDDIDSKVNLMINYQQRQ